MTTIIVILIVWWLVVRIVHLVGRLWRLADAEGSPGLADAAAAGG
jgi:hypothetical protein